MPLFDILNVNPAEAVQAPQASQGLLGIAAQLGQGAGRSFAQAAGKDTRTAEQKVRQAMKGTEYTPESLIAAAQRLDEVGESTRALALRQMAAQMKAEQTAPDLTGRDRYVAVGSNVFDMSTGQWLSSPSEEQVDSLSQQEISQLYRHFTPESIAGFLEDPSNPLALLPEAEGGSGTPEEALTVEQRRANTVSELQSIDSVLESIEDAEGTNIWQFGYDLAKFVPRTGSRELKGYVETIQSNLAFDRLQRMRDESKTGGALGQVSNIELNLLKSAVAALDPASRSFETQLQKVKDHYRNFRNALLGADPVGENYARLEDGSLAYYNPTEEAWFILSEGSE